MSSSSDEDWTRDLIGPCGVAAKSREEFKRRRSLSVGECSTSVNVAGDAAAAAAADADDSKWINELVGAGSFQRGVAASMFAERPCVAKALPPMFERFDYSERVARDFAAIEAARVNAFGRQAAGAWRGVRGAGGAAGGVASSSGSHTVGIGAGGVVSSSGSHTLGMSTGGMASPVDRHGPSGLRRGEPFSAYIPGAVIPRVAFDPQESSDSWWRHLPSFAAKVDKLWRLRPVARDVVRWELQRPDENDAVGHSKEVLNRCIGRFKTFKIGHTHVPMERWDRFVFCKHTPRLLVFVVVSEWVDASNTVEERLVEEFIEDPRCINFRLAGDPAWTDFGCSPFFVYISFQ